MKTFKASIKDFGHEYFVAFMLKVSDDGGDLNEKFQINLRSISNEQMIYNCSIMLAEFKSKFEYTIPNLERWTGMKFCRIQLRNYGIAFIDEPYWSPNVIFINERERYDNFLLTIPNNFFTVKGRTTFAYLQRCTTFK